MPRLPYLWFLILLLMAFTFVRPSEQASFAQTIPQNTPVIYLPMVRNDIPTPTREPTRVPTATPLSVGVSIKSSTGVVPAGSRFYRVYGEVINQTANNAYRVRIKANFFDLAHNLVDSDVTEIFFGMVAPKHVAPFELLASKNINSITSYEATVSFYDHDTTDFRTPTVLSQQIRNNVGIEVFGEVSNDTGATVRGAALALTFYDSSGRVVRAYPGSIDIDLANGQKAAYSISTSDNFGYASYTVQAQSYVAR